MNGTAGSSAWYIIFENGEETDRGQACNECSRVCRDCGKETVIFLMILIHFIRTTASTQ